MATDGAGEPLSPLLSELALTNRTHSDPSKAPGALDVLQRLLDSGKVTEDDLRSAHAAALAARRQGGQTSQQTPPTERSNDDKVNGDTISVRNDGRSDEGSATRTRHIALRVYYDGGPYSGLAENVGQGSDGSVERTLFQALRRAHLIESRDTCGYSRCGRTDRGVSAAGQVLALRVRSAFRGDASLDEQGLQPLRSQDLPEDSHRKLAVWLPARCRPKPPGRGGPGGEGAPGPSPAASGAARTLRQLSEYPYDRILNNLLPPTIRVLGWSPVSEEFSARFSAATRTYRYFFCRRRLDLAALREALALLVGTHDFRNFCKMDVEKVYNFERTIYRAKVVELPDNGLCYLEICGQAFLWHQIRCIAEVLFLVGQKKEDPSVVTELLNVEKYPGKPSYPLADEKPLVLHDCGYKNVHIRYSVQNLWSMMCQQEKQWEELILAAARIRNNIQSLTEHASVLSDDLKTFLQRRSGAKTSRKDSNRLGASMGDDQWPFVELQTVAWSEALKWIERTTHAIPGPNNEKELAYRPLLSRSMGTTYEEKVAAAKKSERRRDRYESNVIKKRKTKEEDCEFYQRMAEQGSSNISADP